LKRIAESAKGNARLEFFAGDLLKDGMVCLAGVCLTAHNRQLR
jgi:hypothetical protein